MSVLTDKDPADTYKDLLHMGNSNSGVDATLRKVHDGEGDDTPLWLDKTRVQARLKAVVDDNDNELATFTTVASAVNELDLRNAATGNAPAIRVLGGDADIDLDLTPKGSGTVRPQAVVTLTDDIDAGSSHKVINLPAPTNANDAARKDYVDTRPLDHFPAATADVSMGGFQITNLAGPGTDTDAATRKYVDDNTSNLTLVTWKLVEINGTDADQERVLVNTATNSGVTRSLPSSPKDGASVWYADAAKTWKADNLTVDGNGSNIEGASTFTADLDAGAFEAVYNQGAGEWKVRNQTAP